MQFLYSYFHFFSAVIYLILCILILVRDWKSRLNQTCASLVFCFFVWSLSFTWIHNPASSKATALLCENIGTFGWVWFGYFHLWFAWLYTKRRSNHWTRFLAVLVTVIPILLVYQQWTHSSLIAEHLRRSFGWLSQWRMTFWTILYYGYCVTVVPLGLYLIIDYGVKTDNVYIRRQSILMLITGAVTLLIGSLVNIVFSLLVPDLITPVGDATGLIWASGLTYVAIKYNMLNITPFIAADRIIATMKDLLFLLDTHGYIISVNQSATQTLICKNYLLIGRRFVDLIPESEPDRSMIIDRLERSETFTGDTVLTLTPGPIIPVTLSASVIPGTGIVCVAHNISLQKKRTASLHEAKLRLEKRISKATEELQTANLRLMQEVSERKLAAIALKESEERFRVIYEFAPDGIYLVDHQGIFVDGNNAALRITGYTKEELAGKKIHDIELRSVNSSVKPEDIHLNSSADSVTPYQEFLLKRKDGSVISVEISAYPIKTSGKILSIGIVRDLSQRKKAEAEAEELKRELHHAQKMDAIGRLAGGIAHDFNNLLGGIIGYAGLLRKRLGDKQVYEASVMQRIIDVAKQASERTAQLLAFARKGKYRTESVNIHDLVEEVTELLEHTVDPRISLVKEYNAEFPIVVGDKSQLYSALLNLGVNARDALPDGGTITFTTDNIEIAPELGMSRHGRIQHGTYVRLTVADNGVGMDEATRSRIFEPFFSTKEPGKGTGLGLASVYGTITHHNGFIELESTPGKGSKFNLCLPVADIISMVEPEAVEVRATPHCCGNVLVVDDTPFIRDMMTDSLSDCGYTVHACGDGRDALDWFKAHHTACDLVILDFTMPHINGKECFRVMKKINPRVKAIITSGHAIDSEIRATLEDGVAAFLQKPFEVETLVDMVQTVVARGHNDSSVVQVEQAMNAGTDSETGN